MNSRSHSPDIACVSVNTSMKVWHVRRLAVSPHFTTVVLNRCACKTICTYGTICCLLRCLGVLKLIFMAVNLINHPFFSSLFSRLMLLSFWVLTRDLWLLQLADKKQVQSLIFLYSLSVFPASLLLWRIFRSHMREMESQTPPSKIARLAYSGTHTHSLSLSRVFKFSLLLLLI